MMFKILNKNNLQTVISIPERLRKEIVTLRHAWATEQHPSPPLNKKEQKVGEEGKMRGFEFILKAIFPFKKIF
jgi:hypothetical protein